MRFQVPLLVAAALSLGSPFAAEVSAQPSKPIYAPPPGKAATEQLPILKEVGVDQKPNAQIPLDLEFNDSTGRTVTLREYFTGRPVVLALVYYECPMLCTQVLNGLVGSLEALAFSIGKEFDVVAVSFDPGETPALAAQKKALYLRRYGREGAERGMHFLTGRQASITALADAVGFRYAYDAAIDQYAHPAAVTLLTGEGRVSRYLFGIEFAPRDFKLALVETTAGKIGSVVDQLLLFCYHYDPESGKYGFVVMNLVRGGGILTLVLLGGGIFISLRRERRQALQGAR